MWYGWNTAGTSLLLSNFRLPPPSLKSLAPKRERFLESLFSFRRVLMETALTDCFPPFPTEETFSTGSVSSPWHIGATGFFTMLVPLQDYICPRDPESSSLLFATKGHYFARISVNPIRTSSASQRQGNGELRREHNVEHLLDAFTAINSNSESA